MSKVETYNSIADLQKRLNFRVKELQDRVKSMHGKRVIVGIPPGAKYPDGKSVAKVADQIVYGVNENGTRMRAGPRPFIKIAELANGKKWLRMLQDGVREELRRRQSSNLRPLLLKVGNRMVSDIRKVMIDLDVYDTGKMHDSITVLQVNNKKV